MYVVSPSWPATGGVSSANILFAAKSRHSQSIGTSIRVKISYARRRPCRLYHVNIEPHGGLMIRTAPPACSLKV